MAADIHADATEANGAGSAGDARGIFLSYARKDGHAFAAGLRARLEDLGYEVWQDVVDMIGGQGWWLQIEDRIEWAQAVVTVATPGALASPVARREWAHARRIGTPFLPVTDDPLVFDTAPRWLGKLDVFVLAPDHPYLAATWARFTDQLARPPALRPVPFMAPALPAQFAAREDPRRALVDNFLDERGEEPRFATLVVHGPPGFGKTVLAQEVSRDPRVIDAFTGGVLWVTSGEQGQGVVPGLNAAVSVLSGASVAFNTVEEGAARLAELLESRDCLLVLDDAWDRAHLEPFLASAHAARLITTRAVDNASPDGAVVWALDEMRPDEATQVLLNYVPPDSLDEVDEAEARQVLGGLAARLGEWPLLLGIFGGALRSEIAVRERRFRDAVAWLKEGLDAAGLTAFDRRRSEDRNEALARSVEVSLRPFSETERDRLFELTAFPPGEPIPDAIALRLWEATGGMGRFEAERLLREFAGTFFGLDGHDGTAALTLRFHDALREHLGAQLSAERTREVHRLLLASYVPEGTAAPSVPDDGYLYDHLAYHLQAGGEADALYALVADPAWFEARLAQRGYTYDGVVADVERAADTAAGQAHREIDAGGPPRAVAHLARYRLMRATIDGLAGSRPPELVVRALELGLWTPAQAVSVAGRVPEPGQRLHTLRQLLTSTAPLGAYRDEVERLALATVEEWLEPRAYDLAELADHLSSPRRDAVLRRALRAATEYPRARDAADRGQAALGVHSGYLPTAETAHALAAVARRLHGQQRETTTRDGLAVARRVDDAKERAYALSWVDGTKERAYALAAWIGLLAGDEQQACYQDACDTVGRIDNQQERLYAAAAVAVAAGGDNGRELLDTVWTEAQTIADEPWRAFCLARAAPHLDPARRRQCLELALRHLKPERAEQAEARTRGIVRGPRAQVLLLALGSSLTSEEAEEVSGAVERLDNPEERAELLLELGLPVGAADLERMFQAVLASRDAHGSWPPRIAQLAPRLPRRLVEQGLGRHVRELRADETAAIARLEARLGDGRTDGAVGPGGGGPPAAAVPAHRPPERSWLLGDYSPLPADEDPTPLLDELRRIADMTDEGPRRADEARSHALLSVIAQLPSDELGRARQVAMTITDGWYRSQPLVALALRLEGDQREDAARAGVDALLEPGPGNADWRANIIERAVPVLTPELVSRLLDGVADFEEWGRIRALKALFPLVRAEQLGEALAAVRRLTNDSSKADLLRLLQGAFTEDGLGAVVEVADGIADERHRVPVLELLASHATGIAQDAVVGAARRLSVAGDRARVLARLLPAAAHPDVLLPLVRREVVDHLHRSPRVPRADVLGFLADRHVVGEAVLDRDSAERVARAAVKVCRHWPWQ